MLWFYIVALNQSLFKKLWNLKPLVFWLSLWLTELHRQWLAVWPNYNLIYFTLSQGNLINLLYSMASSTFLPLSDLMKMFCGSSCCWLWSVQMCLQFVFLLLHVMLSKWRHACKDLFHYCFSHHPFNRAFLRASEMVWENKQHTQPQSPVNKYFTLPKHMVVIYVIAITVSFWSGLVRPERSNTNWNWDQLKQM